MSKKITVTENYQIKIESNQYIVRKLHTVDPKNSPRYNPEKHGENPAVRYEWKDEGYFGLHNKGLHAAIKSIIFKESFLSDKEKFSLNEYLNELNCIADRVFKEVFKK